MLELEIQERNNIGHCYSRLDTKHEREERLRSALVHSRLGLGLHLDRSLQLLLPHSRPLFLLRGSTGERAVGVVEVLVLDFYHD